MEISYQNWRHLKKLLTIFQAYRGALVFPNLDNIETVLWADEIMRICRTAVRKAQLESRRLGIANVYSLNGKRYYELPNGDYSRIAPGVTDRK